mgnify:CR=1 FL=1
MGSAALALLSFLVCVVLVFTIPLTFGVFILGGIPAGNTSIEYGRLGPGMLLVFQLALFWLCAQGVLALWRSKPEEGEE